MLAPEIEEIAKAIVDAAFKVHSKLGPGLLERVYEQCFCIELDKKGIQYQRQVTVPIQYDGYRIKDSFRIDVIDVLVDNTIICELKAVEAILPVHKAQLITYLKLTKKPLGFLINFNVARFSNGIKRLILNKKSKININK